MNIVGKKSNNVSRLKVNLKQKYQRKKTRQNPRKIKNKMKISSNLHLISNTFLILFLFYTLCRKKNYLIFTVARSFKSILQSKNLLASNSDIIEMVVTT